jgi:large repetitive protein
MRWLAAMMIAAAACGRDPIAAGPDALPGLPDAAGLPDARPDAGPPPDALPPQACADSIDNDGDLLVDYPYDPGCENENDMYEDDPEVIPQCADGIDNDGNGEMDYPADEGCYAASDTNEFHGFTNCGPSSVVEFIPYGVGMASGTFSGPTPNEMISTCGGLGGERVFTYWLSFGPAILTASTDHPETTVDTIVHIRTVCLDADTELGCDDDGGSTAGASVLSIGPISAGWYIIVVDTFGPGSLGDFLDTVTAEPAP